KRSEAGVDAVRRLGAAGAALDHSPRRLHERSCGVAEGDPFAVVGDGEQLFDGQRRTVKLNHAIVVSPGSQDVTQSQAVSRTRMTRRSGILNRIATQVES